MLNTALEVTIQSTSLVSLAPATRPLTKSLRGETVHSDLPLSFSSADSTFVLWLPLRPLDVLHFRVS